MKKVLKSQKIAMLAVLAACIAVPSSAYASGGRAMMWPSEDLASRVKMTLDADPELKPYDIKTVTLPNGVLRLSGDVMWASEKDKAAQIALSVYGVHKVSNTIGISGVTDDFSTGG